MANKKTTYTNKSFKIEKAMSPRLIFSIVTFVLGIASLIFLCAPGLTFNFTNSAKGSVNLNLGALIWGGGDYGSKVSVGLIIAFFFTIAGSLLIFACPSFPYIAILSFLFFITSAVLFFCIIPLTTASVALVGRGSASMAFGTICAGGLQIAAGITSIVALKAN